MLFFLPVTFRWQQISYETRSKLDWNIFNSAHISNGNQENYYHLISEFVLLYPAASYYVKYLLDYPKEYSFSFFPNSIACSSLCYLYLYTQELYLG